MNNKQNKIYFIRSDNGLIKIGKSNTPKQRLKHLSIGSPVLLRLVKTIEGGLYLENILHLYFEHINTHGEWFKPDYELNSFIKGNRKISISGILDVVRDKLNRQQLKYLEKLEKTRLYL